MKEIAVSYETVEGTPFQNPLSRGSAPILSRYVPALLTGALRNSMAQALRFHAASADLHRALRHQAELQRAHQWSAQRREFRAFALGKTIAAMSPRRCTTRPTGGKWPWHELAHVFAIQLSKARVPRWFHRGAER